MASFDEFTLSQNLVGWTGAELEFLAEDSPVDIKPSFSSELIPLLGGNAVGPFRPPLSAKVPLWMAVQIKKARTGEIVCPEWLTVPYLDDWLLREQNSDQFCEPPCDHFIEVARVLITYAREDLGADIVLVEDRLRSVCEHRQAKIERGFQSLSDASDSIRMNNLGSAEVNTLRSFATTSLAAFKKLHAVASGAAAESSQASQPIGAGASQASAQASQQAAAAAMPVAQGRNSLRQQATRQLHQAAARAAATGGAGSAAASSSASASASASSQSSSQPGAPPQAQDEQQRKLRKFR